MRDRTVTPAPTVQPSTGPKAAPGTCKGIVTIRSMQQVSLAHASSVRLLMHAVAPTQITDTSMETALLAALDAR